MKSIFVPRCGKVERDKTFSKNNYVNDFLIKFGADEMISITPGTFGRSGGAGTDYAKVWASPESECETHWDQLEFHSHMFIKYRSMLCCLTPYLEVFIGYKRVLVYRWRKRQPNRRWLRENDSIFGFDMKWILCFKKHAIPIDILNATVVDQSCSTRT